MHVTHKDKEKKKVNKIVNQTYGQFVDRTLG